MQHTYFRFNGTSSDILDLVISSASLFDRIAKFSVLEDEDLTSDYLPIVLELKKGKGKNEVEGNTILNYKSNFNLNKANWDLFKKKLPKHIAPSIENDVEELNKFIIKSMLDAASSSIPLKNTSSKYKNH